MSIREDKNLIWFFTDFGGEWIDNFDFLKLIKSKFKAIGNFTRSWEEINRVTLDPEISTFKSQVISVILHSDEINHQISLIKFRHREGIFRNYLPGMAGFLEMQGHFRVMIRRTNTINTRNRSHDDSVWTCE